MILSNKILIAPYILCGGKYLTNKCIKIGNNGIIEDIVGVEDLCSEDLKNAVKLEDQAILPGFINCHSHAFHKFLRGRSCIGVHGEENFWKWRDNMYTLLKDIDYSRMFHYCKETFIEMIESGITTVGEFHYVHHSKINNRNFDLDKAVLNAAMETGIRLVFIATMYTYPGLDRSKELNETQKHFKCDINEFLEYIEKFKKEIENNDTITLGIAAHSIRGVSNEDIKKLWKYCQENNLPFHIHLEEQPQEIEDSIKYLNKEPTEILLDNFKDLGPINLTAIHCSFTKKHLLRELTKNEIKICVCPLTEGYLGDNVPLLEVEDKIVLGTDCNNRISMIEEARWLAYGQHLRNNNRNHVQLSANKLIKILTENGGESLGVNKITGSIKKGYKLDFVSIKLKSTVMKEIKNINEINDGIIFSCGNKEIGAVCVNGKILYHCI
uniref:Amidohydro-rel domain-containing protein n=1 Tax=Parastrongyloides trichosuri TaxID=131310 RepID=A0A0N4ZNQ7_PARTI